MAVRRKKLTSKQRRRAKKRRKLQALYIQAQQDVENIILDPHASVAQVNAVSEFEWSAAMNGTPFDEPVKQGDINSSNEDTVAAMIRRFNENLDAEAKRKRTFRRKYGFDSRMYDLYTSIRSNPIFQELFETIYLDSDQISDLIQMSRETLTEGDLELALSLIRDNAQEIDRQEAYTLLRELLSPELYHGEELKEIREELKKRQQTNYSS